MIIYLISDTPTGPVTLIIIHRTVITIGFILIYGVVLILAKIKD